ncbi:hypothetical protein DFH01_08950 [Falsiroseomonas bella]|uniref:Peptidase C39-like domain-containing protein n=1 Tax=Falsiroseomonas bella TaxID=2184016 RepID=A0A317FH88_9PROT|nr:hypothetical protein [Falsiroseomonas bella]PWS36998.1 hypothetical protein DFH01_08950 [Falsiroseomonas bella]
MPPYRAQWESVDLVAEFLAGRDPASDPLWYGSGAASAADYALWADHLCGCACLQMALGARGRPVPPIHVIRRAVQGQGGYVVEPDGTIRGLIYAGAVAWLAGLGLEARIALDVQPGEIPALVAGGGLFIASVHGTIRWPDREPPRRGGHLVLVFGTDEAGRLRFHNPSGDTPESRADARLAPDSFGRFFAGRGIHIG